MSLVKFLLALAVVTMAAIAPVAAEENRLFEMRVYFSAPGKLAALNARFRDHTVKLFEKHGITNVGYFEPQDNPDGKLVYFLAYKDPAARKAAWAAFLADPDWQAARKASEADGKLVAKVEEFYLTPTDYSSLVRPAVAAKERVFELRTYTATPGNLPALNARFRDHTAKLFETHGITNVGYWTLATGPGVPVHTAAALADLGVVSAADQKASDVTLVYLLAHLNGPARDKSFAEFRDDPDWKKALAASEAKAGGPLTVKGGVKSVLLTPTDYSPMK